MVRSSIYSTLRSDAAFRCHPSNDHSVGSGPLTLKLADTVSSETLIVSGDVIKIFAESSELEFYFAAGAINSPGQKAFHSGLTLMQAIIASGGVTENSAPFARISRQDRDGRLVSMQFSLAEIESGKIADPVLSRGDRIEVKIAL